MDYVIVLAFLAALAGGLWLVIRRAREFDRVLQEEGFAGSAACPDEVRAVVRSLFDAELEGPCYRSRHESTWGPEAWMVTPAPRPGEPSTEVLLVPAPAAGLPEFAIAASSGVEKLERLVPWHDRREAPFARAGFQRLPDPLQPFLERRRPLVLYARKDLDLRAALPAELFERMLRIRGVQGVASLGGRIAVWTCAREAPRELFAAARSLHP